MSATTPVYAAPAPAKGYESTSFAEALRTRRTIYALSDESPIPNERIVEIVKEVVKHAPSSFNSQSTRAIVVFGDKHKLVWDAAKSALKAILPAEAYPASEQRLNGFQAGTGTVLLYEDQSVVKGLQEKLPTYSALFPLWSEHTHGIHAFAIWTALELEGLGANLQHYSNLIEKDLAKEFDVPESWQLTAQLVFGKPLAPAGEKTFQPLENRVKVFGA
ncbi:hypothetical protein JCM8547_002138 [Rhodosporidiobolus lusitaniae]